MRTSARAGLRRRQLLAAAAWAVSGAAARPAAAQPAAGGASDPFDFPTLMALLAQRTSGEARFTEERTVTGFDGPLRASGTLSFTAPDRFVRQTLQPQRERMEVAGNQLKLVRGSRVRQMTLDAVPELTALVEGLRGTLTGNGALLRRHFEVRVAGDRRLWTLTLLPREPGLAAQVRTLTLAGTAGELRTVELTLAGNERSLMTIEPLPANAGAANSGGPNAAGVAAPPATTSATSTTSTTSATSATSATPATPAVPASAPRR